MDTISNLEGGDWFDSRIWGGKSPNDFATVDVRFVNGPATIFITGSNRIATATNLTVGNQCTLEVSEFLASLAVGKILVDAGGVVRTSGTITTGSMTIGQGGTFTIHNNASLVGAFANSGVINEGDGGGIVTASGMALTNLATGVIRATNSTLEILLNHISDGDVLKNNGVIEAVGKGTLTIDTSHASDTRAAVQNTGTIRTGAGGRVVLENVEIRGGSLGAVAGSSMSIGDGAALTGVSMDNRGDLAVDGTSTLKDSTIVNTGNLTGAGVINNSSLFNDVGGRIDGAFRITLSASGGTSNVFNNFGSLSGAKIRLDESGFFENRGTVTGAAFSGGGTVRVTSTGVIDASSFDHVRIALGGTVRAVGAGQEVRLDGADVDVANLASSSGGVIRVLADPTATTFDEVGIAKGSAIVVDNNATLRFGNESSSAQTLDNLAIAVNGGGKATTLSFRSSLDEAYELQGGTRITLSDSAFNNLVLEGEAILRNVSGLISGAGEIESTSDVVVLENLAGGTIEATGKSPLIIDLDHIRNEGIFEADGGTLQIITGNAIQGAGKVQVTNGGTVDLSQAKQFLGDLVYAGRGTIEGTVAVPTGTIRGFGAGNTYVFGQKTSFSGQLTTSWAQSTGTLTIMTPQNQVFATLRLADGVYSSTDFAATQVTQPDGGHVALSFVGPLSWAKPVNGLWQTAANWNPTGRDVPGAADNAVIAVAGGPYTVASTADTTVKSLGIGASATLSIKAGKFTITNGTSGVPNAGTLRVESGGTLVSGGAFQQAETGKIVAGGAGATVEIAKGASISNGRIKTFAGSFLNADNGGTVALNDVDVDNDGTLTVDNKTRLTLTDGSLTGDGSVRVAGAAVLALDGTIMRNEIDLLEGGDLVIVGDTALKGAVTMAKGSQILSDGAPALLVNYETISGSGKIGDANLTFANEGTIMSGAGATAGDIDIVSVFNEGVISALTGGSIDILGSLDNRERFEAKGGTAKLAGDVANAGLMTADGAQSLLRFMGDVANSDDMTATDGGTLEFNGAITQGAGAELLAFGRDAQILLERGASVSGGSIDLALGAHLLATDGGVVTVAGAGVAVDASSDIAIQGTTLNLVGSAIVGRGVLLADGGGAILGLTDSRLTGGSYLFGAKSQMRVIGKAVLDGAVIELGQDAKIVSAGAPAELTNDGFILGNGAVVGDTNLTLINNGMITTDTGGAELTIEVGANGLVNNGRIQTSDASSNLTLLTRGAPPVGVLNKSSGNLVANAGQLNVGRVVNDGLIAVSGTGHITIGNLVNHEFGTVTAKSGGSLDLTAVTNDGLVTAAGGSSVTFHNFTQNTSTIRTTGGTITFDDLHNDEDDAGLVLGAGGRVQVNGFSVGGRAKLKGDGAVVDFEGDKIDATDTNVTIYNGVDGSVVLDNSARYTGLIRGFDKGDSIDVKDVAFVAGMSSYDAGTRTLNITDGTHSAAIHLVGQYAASQFVFASDGHGGTLVTVDDPAFAAMTLAAAHA